MNQNQAIQQLFEIYQKEERWQKFKISYPNFYVYTKILIDRGNLFWVERDGWIVGYMELLKIGFEQLGRLVCDELFCVDIEDTVSGDIAWVHNFWIDSRYRNGSVIKEMKEPYYRMIADCKYITGKKNKGHEAIKVYKNHLKTSTIGA
jgi:hypothetical protein